MAQGSELRSSQVPPAPCLYLAEVRMRSAFSRLDRYRQFKYQRDGLGEVAVSCFLSRHLKKREAEDGLKAAGQEREAAEGVGRGQVPAPLSVLSQRSEGWELQQTGVAGCDWSSVL